MANTTTLKGAVSMDYGPYNSIRIDRSEDGVMILSLNRPEKMNAIDITMFEEINNVLELLKRDLETRVVILRGEGDKGFCGGLDFKNVITPQLSTDTPRLYDLSFLYSEIQLNLRKIPQPVIVVVHGAAAGAGFCLTMAADIRIISPEARFCNASILAGVTGADMGNIYFLPRQIGSGRAYDILLTGRFMYAEEAMQLGFASYCEPKENLMEKALEVAGDIAKKDPLAIRLTKEAINLGLDCSGLEAALHIENRNQQAITCHTITKAMRAKR